MRFVRLRVNFDVCVCMVYLLSFAVIVCELFDMCEVFGRLDG